jgi:O-antigen chain-terminating methyltransferase
VGAGRGYFLEALRARGIECIGVDISEMAVSEARRIGAEVVLADATEFLTRQSQFAGCFVSHLVEHLDPDRTSRLLRAAHHALLPRATILVVTPNPRDWMVMSEIFWLDPTHVRPYPAPLVQALLEEAGFIVDATGLGHTSLGRRKIPSIVMNRLRYGAQYGRGEVWVRARRR